MNNHKIPNGNDIEDRAQVACGDIFPSVYKKRNACKIKMGKLNL